MTSSDDVPGRSRRTTPMGTTVTPAERDAATLVGGGSLATDGGLHRLLVESVDDYAIFALDAEGHVLSWNPGAQRFKGYTADEIVGRHFSVFYRPQELAEGKPARELADAVRDGRVEDEGWRVRKDGTLFWANVVIVTLRDETGTLVGFAKITRDLTERRRAEEALRQSEERFRLLVQSARSYAIFMLDPEGRVASWNAGARAIKGYETEEIIGRHFSTFYPAEDLTAGKPAWELEVAIREGKYEEEGWRVRKDGTLFWANVVITTLWSDVGTHLGFAKVTQDLTERRAARERELADTRRIAEAEASSRIKSQFLTAMSHELRTPINATMGYAQLIEMGVSGPTTEQQRTYLSRIRGSQEHLLGIVNDLLNYGRIEAGQVRYERAPVPMHAVVETVLPMVEPQAAAKGLTVEHGPSREDVIGLADRSKTEQIVLNLLSNAVKFTPRGGRIAVRCASADGQVVIVVTDSGPGVPPEQQTAVFEPFVQLGRTLTSGHEGTGLGLAISRDLARAMGGDVTVASEPGEGAAFTLALPAT
jgi:PAS domain S-box-containing protein